MYISGRNRALSRALSRAEKKVVILCFDILKPNQAKSNVISHFQAFLGVLQQQKIRAFSRVFGIFPDISRIPDSLKTPRKRPNFFFMVILLKMLESVRLR